MKKACLIIAIILNLIIVINIGYCQSTVKVEVSNLMIVRSGKPISINLGSSKKQVLRAFGKPVRIIKSYFVKFDFRGEMIDYKGAQFYFGGNLIAFELKSSQFSIKVKGTNSYAVIGSTSSGFVKVIPRDKFTTITLQENGVPYDEVLGLTFDAKNKISNITCGPD
jgi:hypothetical protein